jgi:hypothetical protein
MPFGERATAYPGLAPLGEIFLAELSGRHVKVPPVELTSSGERVLARREPTTNGPGKDVESGETMAGDGKMLVAGKS